MLWGSSNSTAPCNGTSFLSSQEANVFVLALIYYSFWGSFAYADSVEAKLLFCSTEQFQEAAFLKLSRALLHVTFSLPTNLLDPKAAPLWSGSRHSVAFSERESQFWYIRPGFQRRFPPQNYFQDFSIFQCCPCFSQELSHSDSRWLPKGSSSSPKLHFEHESMAVLCLAHRHVFSRAYPWHRGLALPRCKERPGERAMVLSYHASRMQTWNDAMPQGRQ